MSGRLETTALITVRETLPPGGVTRRRGESAEPGDVPLVGGVSRHRAGSVVCDFAAFSSGIATSSGLASSSAMECSLK